jgi:hypothetical protein
MRLQRLTSFEPVELIQTGLNESMDAEQKHSLQQVNRLSELVREALGSLYLRITSPV